MALTDTEKLDLFHCLEIPYTTSYSAVDGMGAAYVQVANQPILSAAKNVVLKFIGVLAPDAGAEVISAEALVDLAALLDEYHDVRSVDFEQVGGSLGVFSGLNISASRYRDNLKSRVQELVPFLRYHEVLQKQQSAGSEFSGNCIR